MLEMIALWYLYFLTYSFIGWVYESILCSVMERRPVNRGFLMGPICPVYGCGALAVIISLTPLRENIPALFLTGSLLTCAIEYLTAWLLETLFHAKWWDYSNQRFQLHGRVCLLGAVAFGAMSVLILEYVHPVVIGVLGEVAPRTRLIMSCAGLILMTADLITTVCSLVHLDRLLAEAQAAARSMLKWPHDLAEGWRETLLSSEFARRMRGSELPQSLRETMEGLRRQQAEFSEAVRRYFSTQEAIARYRRHITPIERFFQKRMRSAYPAFRHLRYNEALKTLNSIVLPGRRRKAAEEQEGSSEDKKPS